jgi:hypothetical protein
MSLSIPRRNLPRMAKDSLRVAAQALTQRGARGARAASVPRPQRGLLAPPVRGLTVSVEVADSGLALRPVDRRPGRSGAGGRLAEARDSGAVCAEVVQQAAVEA